MICRRERGRHLPTCWSWHHLSFWYASTKKHKDLREAQQWHTQPWATHQWVCWREQSCRVCATFLSGLSESQSRCKQTWGLLSIVECELRISMSLKESLRALPENKKVGKEAAFYTCSKKVDRTVTVKWGQCESISWCMFPSVLFSLVFNILSSLLRFTQEPTAPCHCHESSPRYSAWIFPFFSATPLFLAIINCCCKLLKNILVLDLFLSDVCVAVLYHLSAPLLQFKISFHLSDSYVLFPCPQLLSDEEKGHNIPE